jgi:prepilin-type N-terminal cleavage/methylation domain-containing protein
MPALEALRPCADTDSVRLRLLRKLRHDEGFGLVELMIAMLILTVGLLALLSAFVSGSTTLRRASRTATASTLADTQMELYRALTYVRIAVDSSSIPATSPYTTDSAYSASQVTATCSGTVASNPQCNASRTVTGPDHGIYRVDTYIVSSPVTSGRAVKLVTVVVRDTNRLNGRALARISSSFDQSTGL